MKRPSKVILLRPPDDSPSDFYNMEESLGILYIAAYLRQHGIAVEVVDAIILNWDVKQTVQHLVSEDFDILGITLFNVAIRKTWEIVRLLKQEKPFVHINVGGHYPTFAYQEILGTISEIDSVTRFEGEITFLHLVHALRSGKSVHGVAGIALRGDTGIIVETGLRPRIIDLDSLPVPTRECFQQIQKPNKALSVCTSRGCWAKCKYCTITAFYNAKDIPRWVGRTANNVLDEIEGLYEKFGCSTFAFVDAEFFGPGRKGKERVRAIAEEIQRRGLQIKYSFDCRPEEVEDELFALLKATGLSVVYLGLESGAQSQLDRWDRLGTVEIGRRAVEILKKHDIILQAGFILYDPWTTMEEIVESLQFIQEVKAVSLPLFIRAMEIRPGMDLEKRLEAEANIYKSAPFQYDYRFQDQRVAVFRDALSIAFADLLAVYNKLTECAFRPS